MHSAYMKKLILSGTALLSLLIAPIVLAQTYYPSSYTNCGSIPAGLSVGSRGTDVSNLQSFLVAQNYPGGGSWMITGYFGQATAAAVRNFQSMHGLPQTGMVDTSTAAAMSSCGGVGFPAYSVPTYPPLYPIPTTPVVPVYPVQYPYYNNYYGNTPVITSLSQNTGSAGSTITIYGVGFDQWSNTVHFGGTAVYNVASQNGTSLTVTVPNNYYSYSYAGTVVQITVQNSHGTSNAVSFTMYGNQYGCLPGQGGTYYSTSCGCPPQYTGGYNNSYNTYCPMPNTSTPIISYINPTSGGVGTIVNVYGSGFSASGNSVHFGPGIIANLPSFDGHGLSFTVPSYLSGYGSQPITLSTYQVSVGNAQGSISNAVPFTVTSLGSSSGAPVINSVTGPNSLAVGQQGTWTVNLSSGSNQYLTFNVNWGDQNTYPMTSTQSQSIFQTNSLTHTYYASGTYTIVFTVSNSFGQSNTYTTTVSVSGTSQYNAPVSIANMAFNPQTIYVQHGTTVLWSNNDGMAHTVTSDTGYFASGTLNPGATYSYTFNTPGTYTYHCSIHPQMVGTIIVTQ